jgi:predicted permease
MAKGLHPRAVRSDARKGSPVTLFQDVRLGVRLLLRKPAFAGIAILTLALGIGANTAIFSVVNAALVRPLPFPEPRRLTLVHEAFPALGFPQIGFSAPDLTIYAHEQESFQGVAAYQDKDYELSGAGEPERVTGARVSANLFSVLGVQPALGRTFFEVEDRPGSAVVLLSDGLWQGKYGGSPDVVGRSMTLDRVPYTIVGVMPRDFQFPLRGGPLNSEPAALWVPVAFTPDELEGWGNMYNSSVVARLKPAVKLEQARAEGAVLAERIQKAYPASLIERFGNPTLALQIAPIASEVSGEVRPLLLVLQGAVALVLLIACVNVGLLLLARASGRGREIAVRTALGAGRGRLITQLLSESLVLAIPGGALGLALAVVLKNFFLSALPATVALPHEVSLDGAVLTFTAATTLLTVFLFGLVPAFRATRGDIRGILQEGGRGGTAGRAHHRVQGSLVVVEFALALVLMVGAGLLLRSFAKLLRTNLGFRPESVLALSVSLPAQAYPHASDVRNYYQRGLAELAGLPGVASVAASSDLPLNGNDIGALLIEGRTDLGNAPVRATWILGDYFQTLGISLLRGRAITTDDRQGTVPVALVSEGMARHFWPNDDPLGKRIRVEGDAWVTIVGVVRDVHDAALSAEPLLHVYKAYLQQPEASIEDATSGLWRSLSFAVRTQGDPAALSPAVIAALHRLDPLLPIVHLRTMQVEVANAVAPQRFNAALVGIYGCVALLLALVGIYGVVAYMVAQQTREIAIRMALGAQRREMLTSVLFRGTRLAILGAALGLPAAWAVGRLMASLLYGVSPGDPLTFVAVTLLLNAAALFACYRPALRATRVAPMVALRCE